MSKETDRYLDIIGLPHHVSATRPQMPVSDRAAQFSPFAALTGYDAVIRETGRLTEEKIELGEEMKSLLDRTLQILMEKLPEQPEVAITCFVPDARKNGGTYTTVTGRLKGMDSYRHLLLLTDGREIFLDDILALESSLLQDIP